MNDHSPCNHWKYSVKPCRPLSPTDERKSETPLVDGHTPNCPCAEAIGQQQRSGRLPRCAKWLSRWRRKDAVPTVRTWQWDGAPCQVHLSPVAWCGQRSTSLLTSPEQVTRSFRRPSYSPPTRRRHYVYFTALCFCCYGINDCCCCRCCCCARCSDTKQASTVSAK